MRINKTFVTRGRRKGMMTNQHRTNQKLLLAHVPKSITPEIEEYARSLGAAVPEYLPVVEQVGNLPIMFPAPLEQHCFENCIRFHSVFEEAVPMFCWSICSMQDLWLMATGHCVLKYQEKLWDITPDAWGDKRHLLAATNEVVSLANALQLNIQPPEFILVDKPLVREAAKLWHMNGNENHQMAAQQMYSPVRARLIERRAAKVEALIKRFQQVAARRAK